MEKNEKYENWLSHWNAAAEARADYDTEQMRQEFEGDLNEMDQRLYDIRTSKLLQLIMLGDRSIMGAILESSALAAAELREHIQKAGGLTSVSSHLKLMPGDVIYMDPVVTGLLPHFQQGRSGLFVVGLMDNIEGGGPDTEACDLVPVSDFSVPLGDGEILATAELEGLKTPLVMQVWNTMYSVGVRAIIGFKVGSVISDQYPDGVFLKYLYRDVEAVYTWPDTPEAREYLAHSRRLRDVTLQRLGGMRYAGGYNYSDRDRVAVGYW